MKKLIKLGLVLVILLVIAGVAAVFFLGSIVKAGVEKAGPVVTKVPVKLDGANISVLSGKGELKGFVLGNPEGYKSSEAIKVGLVSIDLDPKSVFNDKVIVRSIRIESPEINYEKSGLKGGNLDQILDNLKTGEKKPGEASPASKADGTSKKLQVDEFLITGAKVHTTLPILGTLTLPLPEIKLTALGQGPDGITAADLGTKAMGALMDAVVKALADAGTKSAGGAIDNLKKGAGGLGDLFKKK